MERLVFSKLEQWKNSPARKPLVLRGARQVGKTWVMKEFGKRYFKNVAYVNFDNNSAMKAVFEGDFDISRILLAVSAETGISVKADETLLVFDEVQEVPRALSSLKYFCEEAPEYAVIAAGSQMGVALHRGTNFPVGKVDLLNLYPLSFTEFLMATENEQLISVLQSCDWNLICSLKTRFIRRMKEYFYVGGMPQAVQSFIDEQDWNLVRKIQKTLLEVYQQDFSKYASAELCARLNLVWNSIPAQLSKENKKFIYGQIKKGSRAKDFALAIQWLSDCGLIHLVHGLSKPGYPLKAYEELDSFKIYMNDIGLLCALGGTDIKTILDENVFFVEFKGALTEQFVLQQLLSSTDLKFFYYSSPNSSGEIDFVTQIEDLVVPIEVKASENLQAKSLKAFHQKWQNEFSVRTSLADFRRDGWLTNVPLYGIHNIEMCILPPSPM
ncbi:MAG: ATP-binding protein [Treponema sp.]|nr:ATP-binding protein [Treponema sp.]